jgi:isopenicillin N synthase-like dioxygenase
MKKQKSHTKSNGVGSTPTKKADNAELSHEKKDKKDGKTYDTTDYPIIELANYLNKDKSGHKKDAHVADCAKISDLLNQYGFLIVRDPRVSEQHNETFIDTMEKYYGQEEEKKAKDVRKDVYYQVGITPTRTERARNHCERIEKLPADERPVTLCPPDLDNKLRFFWRMGDIPPKTEFKRLNADPVIPAGFPQWTEVMNTWGGLMLQCVSTVAEMAAIGFGLPAETFSKMMKYGPHLLAPTGSDFNKFGQLGSVLANYHYDLNFLTIHGKSRFAGLFVWTRDGKRLAVKVPNGCLLLQAGKQFEWLTGGHVLAGFHEVVVAEKTLEAIEAAKKAGKSLWRVSSTLFGHMASDSTLEPLGKFATKEAQQKYPPTKAGTQVQQELDAIKLGRDELAMGVVAAM